MDYESLTIIELRTYAKTHNLKGYSNLRKADLITFLKDNDQKISVPKPLSPKKIPPERVPSPKKQSVIQYTMQYDGNVLIYKFPDHKWMDLIADFAVYGKLSQIFVDILRNNPYESYYFETPLITVDTPLQFAIVQRKRDDRVADWSSFSQHIKSRTPAFRSRSGTLLVIPTNVLGDYTNIAKFFRSASLPEIENILHSLSKQDFNNKYFSTSGDAISWLHFRISDTPLYYQYY